MFDFSRPVLLLTGANGGIGRETARLAGHCGNLAFAGNITKRVARGAALGEG